MAYSRVNTDPLRTVTARSSRTVRTIWRLTLDCGHTVARFTLDDRQPPKRIRCWECGRGKAYLEAMNKRPAPEL